MIDKITIKQYSLLTLIIMLGMVVALLLLEGLVRLLPAGNVMNRPRESLNYYEEVPERVIDIRPNVTDGEISFYGKKFPFWSNELGCFDKPYEGEKPFIYLAGDSLSWGYTSFQDKWGTQLQNIIDTRILKCAVSATGSYHQYLKAKDVLSKHPNPKLILVGYFAQNDALEDYYFPQFVYRGGERVDNPTPGEVPTKEIYAALDTKLYNHRAYCSTTKPLFAFFHRIKCFLHNRSAVYVLAIKGIEAILGKEIQKGGSVFPVASVEALDAHFEALKEFQIFAQSQNATIVFVMIPSREEVYPELFGDVASSTKNRVIQYFNKQGILHVDLQPVFKEIADKRKESNIGTPGDLYWPIEWHLNVIGNQATAYGTARFLYDRKLLVGDEDSHKKLEALEQTLYAE